MGHSGVEIQNLECKIQNEMNDFKKFREIKEINEVATNPNFQLSIFNFLGCAALILHSTF